MPVSVKTFAALDEAARALAAGRSARYLGGGTLVMRALNEGTQDFDTVIRATDAALRQVKPEGDRISLGAGVTMAQVLATATSAFCILWRARSAGRRCERWRRSGATSSRASPYGDFTVALLALEGTVMLAGSSRPVPLEDFLKVRDRDPRPLVAAVTITRPRDAQAFRFHKVSRVKPKGIAVMSIAAHLPQTGGRVTNARVAYGAMGPTPLRVPAVERALEGRSLDAAGIAPALAAATQRVDPPTDALASSWYRREVAPVHLRRLLLGQI